MLTKRVDKHDRNKKKIRRNNGKNSFGFGVKTNG